ncbi:hypothetical protein MMC25_007194 [Agyrium rufum]|nr:hypothetical protein [Agyrium rufum]
MTHGTITATIAPPVTTTVAQSTSAVIVTTFPSIHTIGSSGTSSTSTPSPTASSHSHSTSSIFSSVSLASSSSMDTAIPTSIVMATGTPPPPSSNPTLYTPGVPITMTVSTAATSTVVAAAATSPASLSASSPGLSNGQIAGIVTGSVLGGALILALVFFFCCYKGRRKHRRDSGSSFGGDEEMKIESATVPYRSDPVAALKRPEPPADRAPVKAQRLLGFPHRHHEDRWSLRRKSLRSDEMSVPAPFTFPPQAQANDHVATPISAASYRTTSRLLPDKPTLESQPVLRDPFESRVPKEAARPIRRDPSAVPFPLIAPLRPNRRARRPSYQEQSSSCPVHSRPDTRNLQDPFVDNAGPKITNPRARMYAMERRRAAQSSLPKIITPYGSTNPTFDKAWEPRYPPSLQTPSTAISRDRAMTSRTQPPQHSTSLAPPKQVSFNQQPVSRAISPSFHSSSSRPSYTSSIYGLPSNRQSSASTIFSEYDHRKSNNPRFSSNHPHSHYTQPYNVQPPPQSFPRSGPAASIRPVTHLTMASDTSFDDSEIDDESPPLAFDPSNPPTTRNSTVPQHPTTLSPVAESPAPRIRSPISNLHYPAIPGPRLTPFSERIRGDRRDLSDGSGGSSSENGSGGSTPGGRSKNRRSILADGPVSPPPSTSPPSPTRRPLPRTRFPIRTSGTYPQQDQYASQASMQPTIRVVPTSDNLRDAAYPSSSGMAPTRAQQGTGLVYDGGLAELPDSSESLQERQRTHREEEEMRREAAARMKRAREELWKIHRDSDPRGVKHGRQIQGQWATRDAGNSGEESGSGSPMGTAKHSILLNRDIR